MNTQLLIEILTEELPAIPFLKEKSNIILKWKQILEKNNLNADFDFFYTPRRIVLISQHFPIKQADKEVEFFGPPLEIAYLQGKKENGLSKAGEGFLKKCALQSAEELKTLQKEGKEVLYFSQTLAGKQSALLLGEMVREWLESLSFGKSMRWGDLSSSFIRPIRNIAILLGHQNIECEIYGIKSCLCTFTHRDCGFEPHYFDTLQEYLSILEDNGVMLDPQKRKEKILKDFDEIEKEYQITIERDEELLAEVVAITEYPKALLGHFDQEFLTLPKEVIITSMKENQRYFAIYQEGKLHCGFVVVSNSLSLDEKPIIAGNEKVLRARLSDAMFFYENDLKNNLVDYDLSRINFVEGLGSMQDKIKRESKIAEVLFEDNGCNPQCLQRLLEAVKLSKSDLLSEMVGEFPELQGIMGEYYALAEQKRGIALRDEQIAKALREQYLPNGEEDELPSDKFCAIVAVSFRLDTLLALFSIGKIPSGSKDPFALRRAGNAIIKIVASEELKLTYTMIQSLAKEYAEFEIKQVWEFLLERLEGVLKINASILRSVIASQEENLLLIIQKAQALNEVFEGSDKEALVSTFKRVANITKEIQESQKISPELFESDKERSLFEALQSIQNTSYATIQEYIKALFSLKMPLDEFFDSVMVNAEDPQIRENRKALIYQIYQAFLEVGDIKEISL